MKKGKRFGDVKTHLALTEKADKVYSASDPFDIYEIETDSGYRYNTYGMMETSNLTADELNEMLESLADEMENE